MSTAAATPAPQPAHDTTTPAPADRTGTETAQIHTYHCLCTQLLLASTTPLSLLPRRGGDDTAYILPLPASPPTNADASADTEASPHYALTLSLQPDRTPLVIQRPDGLEKRYCARCARCRVVVGYWLDWTQFTGVGSVGTLAAGVGSGVESNKARTGRRDDVVYMLPGGLLSTEEMAGGRRADGDGEREGQGKVV